MTTLPLLFSGLDTAIGYFLFVWVFISYSLIFLNVYYLRVLNTDVEFYGSGLGSAGVCSSAPAWTPVPLAHVFSHLLRGPGAEVILGRELEAGMDQPTPSASRPAWPGRQG